MIAAAAPHHIRTVDVSNLPSAENLDAWRRCLHPGEIGLCWQRAHALVHMAARLMAKRAALALIEWPEGDDELRLEVAGGFGSRPRVVLDSTLTAWSRHRRREIADVSMSHTAHHAGAMVIARPPLGAAVCGMDLLDVQRWQTVIRRNGAALLLRITTPVEHQTDHIAGFGAADRSAARFALKECVVKAAGGLPAGGALSDILAAFDERQRPHLRCTGPVARHFAAAGIGVPCASVSERIPGLLQATVVMSAAYPA